MIPNIRSICSKKEVIIPVDYPKLKEFKIENNLNEIISMLRGKGKAVVDMVLDLIKISGRLHSLYQ
jgi:hypothetical protein